MSAHEAEPRTAPPDVLLAVEEAIATLQSHPDSAVREAAGTLLEGIDAVHRLGLTHLVGAIHGMAGEAFLNRLTADPAVRLLLMSYNLIAVDRRLQAEEALDRVRGHLHDHGLDIEILEVVGGVVTVRLHWRAEAAGQAPPAGETVRRDIEATLLEHFVGFQELVVRGRHEPSGAVHHVPLDAVRRAKTPVYYDALGAADLAEGAVKAVDVNGVPVLLACVDGEVYAIRNRCGDSPLPLEFGSLTGSELRCSWHGCRYDVRSGRRVDGEAGRLQVFPVAIDRTTIRIALDVAGQGSES
jgi:nitrite reductase/ring-hydroxylating ferredoxin subunit